MTLEGAEGGGGWSVVRGEFPCSCGVGVGVGVAIGGGEETSSPSDDIVGIFVFSSIGAAKGFSSCESAMDELRFLKERRKVKENE